MTPPARWRPSLPAGAFVMGPAICQDCGAIVWFGRSMTRVQGEAVLGEVRTWREWGRFAAHNCHASLAGARARDYNTVVGVSDVSATMRDGAAFGAYSTEGRAVALPPGVRR